MNLREPYRQVLGAFDELARLVPRARPVWLTTSTVVCIAILALADRALGPGPSLVAGAVLAALAAGLLLPPRSAAIVAVAAALALVTSDLRWAAPSGLDLTARLLAAALTLAGTFLAAHLQVTTRALISREHSLRLHTLRSERHGRTDNLTTLPNARATTEALIRDLARAARGHSSVWVLYLEVDDMRGFNRRAGREQGDAYLRELARTVRGQVRAGDVVGRMDGDDLAVVLYGVSAPVVRRIAARLLTSTDRLAQMGAPRVSIGIAGGQVQGWTGDSLMMAARSACLRFKVTGEGRYEVLGRPDIAA